jgi:hypothetical protein
MAEVLLHFTTPIAARDGLLYSARAVGRQREDGEWEGWIEFVPSGEAAPLRSPRETTQPNRRDLEYWASGLTPVYLEGALQRALAHEPGSEPVVQERPAYDAPAPAASAPTAPAAAALRPHPVLDPFDVYRKSGETRLRQELLALSVERLREILAAYRMHTEAPVTADRQALAEVIVAAVRTRLP